MDESKFQSDAGNDADEYRVAPLPKSHGDATSPVYRPAPPPVSDDTYVVGPEVDPAPFSVGSQSWHEAAAVVQRPLDELDVVEGPSVQGRRDGQAALRRAIETSQVLQREVNAGAIGDPVRFTLGGLFLLVTAASVGLAFGSRLPRPIFAGISGAAAFLTLLAAKWLKQGSAVLTVAWYVLLLIYILTSIFAALGL